MARYSRGFELGLLPKTKWNWRSFAASYGLITALILIFLLFGLIMPDPLLLKLNFHVTELIPLPAMRPERITPKPLPVHANRLPPPPVSETPKLAVPREIRPPRLAPQEVEPPKVALNDFAPAVLKTIAGGARPMLIHTGDFQGSSVVPTVSATIQKVSTGRLDDPNGLKPSETSKPAGKLIAAVAGSFDMPAGPGCGNGSGGAKGIKGTVASADFGTGIATPGRGDGRAGGRGAGVRSSGFGTQEVVQMTLHAQHADTSAPPTAVEITYKPNPFYTSEARNLKLEGEVLLEVMFGANGQLQVKRVARGLGHGLDEAAIAAADKIRFMPALRNGMPIDSMALVHVVFQLAY